MNRNIKVPSKEAEQIQKWLNSNEPIPDAGKYEVVKTYSADFDNGIVADIKVVNSPSGAYIDAVLFDDGSEVQTMEPRYTLVKAGGYNFKYNSKIFSVIIE
jgi:hypothetical protein